MILDRPNHLGRVPIILDGSNLFFFRIQIIKIIPEKSHLNLTKTILEPNKTICTPPKQFGWILHFAKIVMCIAPFAKGVSNE